MRTAAIFLALGLCLLAAPAMARADSAFRLGRGRRGLLEAGRALLAIAAAGGLFVALIRGR